MISLEHGEKLLNHGVDSPTNTQPLLSFITVSETIYHVINNMVIDDIPIYTSDHPHENVWLLIIRNHYTIIYLLSFTCETIIPYKRLSPYASLPGAQTWGPWQGGRGGDSERDDHRELSMVNLRLNYGWEW